MKSANTATTGSRQTPGSDPVLVRRIESPLGELTLKATQQGLVGIEFPPSDEASQTPQPPADSVRLPTDQPEGAGADRASTILDRAAAQLGEYFAGVRKDFDLPLCPEGTEFQLAAWSALQTIPYGETWSYGQQATFMGRPTASRAVGAANGRNPLPIVVPCHRVVGANGSLTGFAGGIDTKAALLQLESPEQQLLPSAAGR